MVDIMISDGDLYMDTSPYLTRVYMKRHLIFFN